MNDASLRLIATGGLLGALGACTPDADTGPDAPSAGAASTLPAGAERWQCGPWAARSHHRAASGDLLLALPGGEYVLDQTVSASGARYAGADGIVFWSKGDEAVLTPPGTDASVDCRPTDAPSPWLDVTDDLALRAAGNEPGWMLEIERGEAPTARLETQYGEETVQFASVTPADDGYIASSGTHSLRVTTERTGCRDGMSGVGFPLRVRVVVDGQRMDGCGRRYD